MWCPPIDAFAPSSLWRARGQGRRTPIYLIHIRMTKPCERTPRDPGFLRREQEQKCGGRFSEDQTRERGEDNHRDLYIHILYISICNEAATAPGHATKTATHPHNITKNAVHVSLFTPRVPLVALKPHARPRDTLFAYYISMFPFRLSAHEDDADARRFGNSQRSLP